MSLFQCDNCGCCENTALSIQGCKMFSEDFVWGTSSGSMGQMVCSDCGPTHFDDGSLTGLGEWHGDFDRVFLPKGMFHTNQQGNLEHNESGSIKFRDYQIETK